MKRYIGRIVVLLVVASMFLSISAAALGVYNVNGDTDAYGKSIIDVRDLVRAKKLTIERPDTYDSDFFSSLRRIILGIDEINNQENNDEGIELPILPIK